MKAIISRSLFFAVTLFCHAAWADNCVDIKYINYASLRYSAVSREDILSTPGYEFSEENKTLINLYFKYFIDGGEGKDDRKKDYRIAFKPCTKTEWAFYALDGSAFFVNRLVRFSPEDEKAMDDEMRKWNDSFGLMQID